VEFNVHSANISQNSSLQLNLLHYVRSNWSYSLYWIFTDALFTKSFARWQHYL